MPQIEEALQLLKQHRIPFHYSDEKKNLTLLHRHEIDLAYMRKLGFRISRLIGGHLVVSYKGGRFGLVL